MFYSEKALEFPKPSAYNDGKTLSCLCFVFISNSFLTSYISFCPSYAIFSAVRKGERSVPFRNFFHSTYSKTQERKVNLIHQYQILYHVMISLYELKLVVLFSLVVVEVICQVFRPLLLMKMVNTLVMNLLLILQRKKSGLQIQNIVKCVVQLILEWLASKIKSNLNGSILV